MFRLCNSKLNVCNSSLLKCASLTVCPTRNRPSEWISRKFSTNPVDSKVAIVTGGARGIGKGIIEALLENGARGVSICDILADEAKKLVGELGKKYGEDKILFVPSDVTSQKDMESNIEQGWGIIYTIIPYQILNKPLVAEAFESTTSKFKQLDIVVNNASIMKDAEWEKMISININGVCRGTFLGFRAMGKATGGNGGVIINVGAIVGLQAEHGSPVYTATKHFVVGFTRCMGSDFFFDLTGVKVMSICPGVSDTPLNLDPQDHALQGFKDLGKELASRLKGLPWQPPEEVGKCLITVLKEDKNGSVWVSEGGECWKVKFPRRHLMRDERN